MYEIAHAAETGADEQQAIDRLFELARNGQTGNDEYQQLESLVYGRFIQSYDHITDARADNVRVLGASKAA